MRIRFITRGGTDWGLGHLHRVSWLVSELSALNLSGVVVEIACLAEPTARSFWQDQNIHVLFSAEIDSLIAGLLPQDVAVFDWLDSPPKLITQLTRQGVRCVLLDEYGPAQAEAGLVLNCLLAPLSWQDEQRGSARVISGSALLQLPPQALKLRGIGTSLSQALLAEPASAALPSPVPGPVLSVLVSFGGSAQAGYTQLALEALRLAEFSGKVILIPALEPSPAAGGLDLDCHPASAEFHELLAASDLAILGGGLSLYEALFLGVPSLALALPSVTPGRESHQTQSIAKLAAAEACLDAGAAEDLRAADLALQLKRLLNDPDQRHALSSQGSGLLDGQGLARTIDLILKAATNAMDRPLNS